MTETKTTLIKLPDADIRRLWRSDLAAFRDHLLRLDETSRHMRYGGGVSDAFIAQYAEHCFGKGDLVFGAFVDGGLHGAAELRSNEAIWTEQAPFNRHIHAEAAFSVENAYRKRGLGEKLFRRITEAARNHGVEVIEIVCLPENVAMRRLAAKFKAEFTFDNNQLLGRLTARRPTPFSMLREAAHDFIDFNEALLDANLRALRLGDAA
ncbi:MAG: GNAT family N-acetyltransferase [Pseudomonadota bacterium]|nr:GNAT family N-acetyltransferase [Pseudomonadota bacterium]